jgi:hypothetical protein
LGNRVDQFFTPTLPSVQSKEIVTSFTDKLFALKDLALIAVVLLVIGLIAFFIVSDRA